MLLSENLFKYSQGVAKLISWVATGCSNNRADHMINYFSICIFPSIKDFKKASPPKDESCSTYSIIVHAEKKTSDPSDKSCLVSLINYCTCTKKTSDPRDQNCLVSLFNYCTCKKSQVILGTKISR